MASVSKILYMCIIIDRLDEIINCDITHYLCYVFDICAMMVIMSVWMAVIMDITLGKFIIKHSTCIFVHVSLHILHGFLCMRPRSILSSLCLLWGGGSQK